MRASHVNVLVYYVVVYYVLVLVLVSVLVMFLMELLMPLLPVSVLVLIPLVLLMLPVTRAKAQTELRCVARGAGFISGDGRAGGAGRCPAAE